MSRLSLARTLPASVLPQLPAMRIAQKGAIALAIRLFGAGVALAIQIVLARELGQAGYGEFGYVFAWLQLMLVVCYGGFATAAMRYVAEYRARQQPALALGFIRRSWQITLFESAVLALLMAGCAMAFHRPDSVGSIQNFLIASAALPFLAHFMLSSSVIRGLGHVILSMLAGLVQPMSLLTAVLTIALLLRIQMSPSSALLVNLITAIGALGIVAGLQHHLERKLGWGRERLFRTAEWLSTATQLTCASSLMYLQGRTGVIITGLLLDAQAAGTYAAVQRLINAALIGRLSINLLVGPRFAALHAQQRHVELQRYARLAAWGGSGCMLAAAIVFVVFGKSILHCFGDEFVNGYQTLLVLLGGAAVTTMCGSTDFLLNMTGHHHRLVAILVVSLLVNIALSLWLIPRFGILGTAAANVAAALIWCVSVVYTTHVYLAIWSNVGRINSNKII